jgi:hypothetical protein
VSHLKQWHHHDRVVRYAVHEVPRA